MRNCSIVWGQTQWKLCKTRTGKKLGTAKIPWNHGHRIQKRIVQWWHWEKKTEENLWWRKSRENFWECFSKPFPNSSFLKLAEVPVVLVHWQSPYISRCMNIALGSMKICTDLIVSSAWHYNFISRETLKHFSSWFDIVNVVTIDSNKNSWQLHFDIIM